MDDIRRTTSLRWLEFLRQRPVHSCHVERSAAGVTACDAISVPREHVQHVGARAADDKGRRSELVRLSEFVEDWIVRGSGHEAKLCALEAAARPDQSTPFSDEDVVHHILVSSS